MATEQDVLKYYGITTEDAMRFTMTNVDNPKIIFDTASEHRITTQYLSEIKGYSADVIKTYFESAGLSTALLDKLKLLLNSPLNHLDYPVDFNSYTES
jgi:hypothetical protein